ncbi:MAG TPA: hypothetical protein VHA56_05815 [Mucilaginibacter sp.]|nr:hypothetical protein [Mucilaginibacter sp.]
MLLNRVNPFGEIIRTEARGAWMGNRGLLHNDAQEIVRPFKLKAWIICKLEFKGRRRPVMSPGQYTELFFLDEATAFAAGHRPCFECRRDDATSFKLCWIKGNPDYGFNAKTLIGAIDDVLHRERFGDDARKTVLKKLPADVPDGTFVTADGVPCLLSGGSLYVWSPSGYRELHDEADVKEFTLLTPESVVNAFRAGYSPQTAL